MSYDRKQIILERSEMSEGLGGKYVDLYEFPDGRLELRSKGHSLPYHLFGKDQRVSHTVVVENKRLSHALTIIKKQQEIKREPRVQTNSEKLGYKKNARKLYGPNYKPKRAGAHGGNDGMMKSVERRSPPLFLQFLEIASAEPVMECWRLYAKTGTGEAFYCLAHAVVCVFEGYLACSLLSILLAQLISLFNAELLRGHSRDIACTGTLLFRTQGL